MPTTIDPNKLLPFIEGLALPALTLPDGLTATALTLTDIGAVVVAEGGGWDRAMFTFDGVKWEGELLKDDSFYAVDAEGNVTFVYTEVEGGSGDDPDPLPVDTDTSFDPADMADYQPVHVDMGVLGLDTDFLA